MPGQNNNNFGIVFLGEAGVGKTALCSTMKDKKFLEKYDSTVGADLFSVKDGPLKYTIWDITGNDRYEDFIPMYVRRARIAVYVLDSAKDELENKFLLQKYRDIVKKAQCHSDIKVSELIVFNKCLPTSNISENYIKAVDEFGVATMKCPVKKSISDETEINIKKSLLAHFKLCILKDNLSYGAKIIDYLNSSVFDKEKIKEAKELIQLVQNYQAAKINVNEFQHQAELLIKQIYEQIPKQSAAWKLLNEVACLIALILLPVAIVNCVYNKKVTGQFKLSFFDNFGKSQEVKDLNQLNALITPKAAFT